MTNVIYIIYHLFLHSQHPKHRKLGSYVTYIIQNITIFLINPRLSFGSFSLYNSKYNSRRV